MRKRFSSERINDLSWWLNNRDSANSIEDKQGTEVINWNFEWNKLVVSKWFSKKYVHSWTKVNGLKKIWATLYYIIDGVIYKDWEALEVNPTSPEPVIPYTWFINFDIFEDYIILADATWENKPMYYLNWDLITIDDASLYNTITEKYMNNIIIYKTKSVWGWAYADQIVFSKSASASIPENIIDFSAYDAWVQSVWWQNQWEFSWFAVWENGLYVFKKTSVWYSNSENDTWWDAASTSFNFIFNKITSYWAENQFSIELVKQDILYYDGVTKAVRRIGYEQNLTTLRDVDISDEIEWLISALPSNQSWATTSFLYPNFKLFLRSDLYWSWSNDICLVYNVDRKSWAVESNKLSVLSDWGFIVNPFSTVIYEDDSTYSLDELPKEWSFLSKEYDLWDWIDYKRYWELEIMGKISDNINLFVDIYIDDNLVRSKEISWTDIVYSTFGTNTVGNTVLWTWWEDINNLSQFRKRYDLYNDGRYIKFWLRYEWSWYCEISNINFKYKPLNSYIIYN